MGKVFIAIPIPCPNRVSNLYGVIEGYAKLMPSLNAEIELLYTKWNWRDGEYCISPQFS